MLRWRTPELDFVREPSGNENTRAYEREVSRVSPKLRTTADRGRRRPKPDQPSTCTR